MDGLQRVELYVDAWTATQLDIWREKVSRLKIVRTGSLLGSFDADVSASTAGHTIVLKFLRYGIFQELGTGNGYTRDNPGDLRILDPDYRAAHGLDRPRRAGSPPGYVTSGNPRRRRVWYSRKLYMSQRAMVEDLAGILAEETAAVVCRQLDDVRSAL